MRKEKALILDFINRLKDIKVANGFNTDLGDNVLHWAYEVKPGSKEILNVKDNFAELSEGTNYHETDLEIRIEFGTGNSFGNNTWNRLMDQEEDVHNCIGSFDAFFREKYRASFEPIDKDREVVDAEKIYGEGSLTVRVNFNTEKWMLDTNDYEPEE